MELENKENKGTVAIVMVLFDISIHALLCTLGAMGMPAFMSMCVIMQLGFGASAFLFSMGCLRQSSHTSQ